MKTARVGALVLSGMLAWFAGAGIVMADGVGPLDVGAWPALNATDGEFLDHVQLTWQNPGFSDGMEVQRALEPGGPFEVLATNPPFVWDDYLPCGTTRYYRIYATNSIIPGFNQYSSLDAGSTASCTIFTDDFTDGAGDWNSAGGTWQVATPSYRLDGPLYRSRASKQTATFVNVPTPKAGVLGFDFRFTKSDTLQRAKVLFGYVDAQHYRYASLSRKADGTWRIAIGQVGDTSSDAAGERSKQKVSKLGVGRWHKLWVLTDADGTVQVFVNDLLTPKVTAKFVAPLDGQLGLSTRETVLSIDNVEVTLF